jgi:hypothetical protein
VSERCDVEKPACVGNVASVTSVCVILLSCLRVGIDKGQYSVCATLFRWSLLSTLRDFWVRLLSRGTGLCLAWFEDCVWCKEVSLLVLDLDLRRPLVFCSWLVIDCNVYLSVTCFSKLFGSAKRKCFLFF